MPRTVSVGQYSGPRESEAQLSIQTSTGDITLCIRENQWDKHIVRDSWPAIEGYSHTGIIPWSYSDEVELYSFFAVKFVEVFLTGDQREKWIELDFGYRELPISVSGADVVRAQRVPANWIRVGASICRVEGGYIVYINHGPIPYR
jgi:hypothetical protein